MQPRTTSRTKLLPLLALVALGCTGVISSKSDASPPGEAPATPSGPAGSTQTQVGGLDVGNIPLHQLSSREYDNTVRDLLGTALRPGSLFQSYQAAGFDTLAAAGVMNSRKVSDYLDAAAELAADLMLDPARRASVVTCEPVAAGDTTCAQSIIEKFGLRAFRRPLEPNEVADFVLRYGQAIEAGLDHAAAIGHVVRILLSSPQFIYRVEFDPDASTVHALNGYELGSRLSYLLWSSMPDQALLDAAAGEELTTPERLEAEVERMLQDVRSQELVANFAEQWLGARRLDAHVVDTAMFPFWSDALRLAMREEMAAYFDAFLHGDMTYDTFLTARINFVDDNLAALYGLPAPGGQGLVRVDNTTGLRAGFLGLAGFLTHTSRMDRSAPSIRGQWIIKSLRCQEIELPANFTPPPLSEPQPGQTVRQLVEQHRANPACAPCHDALDPVGLGLESYDAVGQYRDYYADGLPVDASGSLPDGSTFNGALEMADALSKDPNLLDCVAEKLFVYGLGRTALGSEGYLDQVVTDWKARGLSLRNLLQALVVSETFRSRHGTP